MSAPTLALVDGNPVWWRHTTGVTAPGGTFDYWHIHAEAMPEIEDWCGAWSRKHLAGYNGMANFETIGGRIIEAHLRFADQWPDLYGPGWMEAVVGLYATGRWDYRRHRSHRRLQRRAVRPARAGATATLRPQVVERALGLDGVSSVQITFHDDRDPAQPFDAAGRLPPRRDQRHLPCIRAVGTRDHSCKHNVTRTNGPAGALRLRYVRGGAHGGRCDGAAAGLGAAC